MIVHSGGIDDASGVSAHLESFCRASARSMSSRASPEPSSHASKGDCAASMPTSSWPMTAAAWCSTTAAHTVWCFVCRMLSNTGPLCSTSAAATCLRPQQQQQRSCCSRCQPRHGSSWCQAQQPTWELLQGCPYAPLCWWSKPPAACCTCCSTRRHHPYQQQQQQQEGKEQGKEQQQQVKQRVM